MDSITTSIKLVLFINAVLGLLIVALALHFYFGTNPKESFDVTKTVYDYVVLQTLLPVFKTAMLAILTWIFGKPVVQALVTRMRANK